MTGEMETVKIALSPGGKKVVSGSDDGAVKLCDIDTCKVITNGRVAKRKWYQSAGGEMVGESDTQKCGFFYQPLYVGPYSQDSEARFSVSCSGS
ncbi:hypothetical protein P692DRAFT_20836492 [Suillus brevipes Sb2]|nr:hypothetical protein P692DRAFT_20836492 [Suillus brevipes Sb2]